jgi:DNA invertase Pin-like site-specific DNA recombinase
MKSGIKCKLIGYRRVSTQGQAQSGLGLEAQDKAISDYQLKTGCHLVATYTEVETGKRSDRPEMLKAIAHAKRVNATLVIAKLDRLGRNVHFISGLMESGVDFVAADSPNDDRFMLHIKAAVAEDEARKISDRTKAALAAYKARGGVLGGRRENARFNLNDAARTKGTIAAAKSHKERADEAYTDIAPMMAEWRAEGLTFQAIANRLNAEGHTTRRGAEWNPVQVSRVLGRVEI